MIGGPSVHAPEAVNIFSLDVGPPDQDDLKGRIQCEWSLSPDPRAGGTLSS